MKKIGLCLMILAGFLAVSCASLGSVNNGTLVIKDGVKAIPDAKRRVNEYNVTIRTTGKYEHKMLTSVVFPASLTKIGSGAFKANNLTSITIPNGVTSIGEFAFQQNQLTSITVSGNVSWLEGIKSKEDQGAIDYMASLGLLVDTSAFGSGFTDAYNANGGQAGTYTRPDTNSKTWTRQ